MAITGLEDLYREIILDHYRSPRNRGELDVPPAHRFEGFNPLCGDEIVVYLQVNGDVVEDIAIGGQGCSISQSSASLMSSAVKGKPLAEVRRLVRSFNALLGPLSDDEQDEPSGLIDTDALGELAAMQGVMKFPARIKCATLSWNILVKGLDEIEDGETG